VVGARQKKKKHFDAVVSMVNIIASGRRLDSGKDGIIWRKKGVLHDDLEVSKEIKKSRETTTDSGLGVGKDSKWTC
jgi:hypothetical protein